MGGDEISQVCMLEIEGCKFAFNASAQMASWILQAMKALYGVYKQSSENRKTAKLEEGGEKTRPEIMQLSKEQGGLPQIVQIPENKMDEVMEVFEKNGLRWARTIDFNPNDGLIPVQICPQDHALAAAIVQSVMKDELEKNEKICDGYNQQIQEVSEKLINASDQDEKERMEVLLENLTRARDEKVRSVDSARKTLEDGAVISFMDYLAQAKGTEFEKDPMKAMEDYEERGIEIGPAFEAKECMTPIRDPGSMPEGQMQFILPESKLVITRAFDIDQETGLVFSNYSFKTQDGEIYQFTDRNMTNETWNEKILPDMLDKVNITETTKCQVFTTKQRLDAYLKYYEKAEENNLRTEPVFSSADVKRETEYAVSEKMKASAPIKTDKVVFDFPKNKLLIEQGKMRYTDGPDEYIFSDFEHGVAKENELSFEMKNTDQVKVIHHGRHQEEDTEELLTALSVKSMFDNKAAGESVEIKRPAKKER